MRVDPAPQPGKPLATEPGLRMALLPLGPHSIPARVSTPVFCSAVAHVPLNTSGKERTGIGHLSPTPFFNVLLWKISNIQW